MRLPFKTEVLSVIVTWFGVLSIQAQSFPEQMKQTVSNERLLRSMGIKKVDAVFQFYALQNYEPAFFKKGNEGLRQQLLSILSNASHLGLQERDYQASFIYLLKSRRIPLENLLDSVGADIRLADAALHFLSEVYSGNNPPVFSYDGVRYQPGYQHIPALLRESLSANSLEQGVEQAEPDGKEYKQVKIMLRHLNALINEKKFVEQKILYSNPLLNNKPLMAKLHQLDLLDTTIRLTEKNMAAILKRAEMMFDTAPDGILDKAIIEALNIPLRTRVRELQIAINSLRWLHVLKRDSTVVVVNIPSATMFMYQKDTIVLESKIIAGKASSPTPTLTSRLNEVILYPYWHVPSSIATRELLPYIKRDVSYLDMNGFQVLNRQGTLIDPATVNWQNLSVNNFPYILRQSTGCDNSLGILKFNFYNPFSVYLHDTPGKILFQYRKRFFSHGCMRVEKPVDLAKLLLQKDNETIDQLTEKCLKEQKPMVISIISSVPLVVLYSTVWYTADGRLQFYRDVYSMLKRTAVAQRN